MSGLGLAGAGPASAAVKAVSERWTRGGLDGVVRARFGYTATGHADGFGIISIPQPGVAYAVALTTMQFDESDGSRFSMTGDGTVTINRTGVYQLSMNFDWPAQHGVATDLRKMKVYRADATQPPPIFRQGVPTPLQANSGWPLMMAHDEPGSDVPRYARGTVDWAPGDVGAGRVVTLDVQMASPAYTLVPGELVSVSLTTLTDDVIGSRANAGMLLSARAVSTNLVRVFLENRYGAASVTVPQGSWRVLGYSSLAVAGNSFDGWAFTNSPMLQLNAGDKLFVGVRVGTQGDYLQIDNLSFMQISALG